MSQANRARLGEQCEFAVIAIVRRRVQPTVISEVAADLVLELNFVVLSHDLFPPNVDLAGNCIVD